MCYFGETPKRAIAKFSTKNIETLSYIPPADSMPPSWAVLKLFATESPILRFHTFGAPLSYRILELGVPGLMEKIALSSAQIKFILRFRNIALFRSSGHPVKSGLRKMAQNCEFLTPCKF